ncbi:MAG: glycoside hydrolase family 97 catalytic domain-containing protein [Bacteroidaceae bacterium]|nr:glycoside hydrolase family 97 catalytic domain-containing protein [Bacteroidaceae bacterium]
MNTSRFHKSYLIAACIALQSAALMAQVATVQSPDQRLKVNVDLNDGIPSYNVVYDGKQMLENSPLGFVANIGDYSKGLTLVDTQESKIDETYTLNRSKVSTVHYVANELKVNLRGGRRNNVTITFRVSNNDIAFRYELPKVGETGSVVIKQEQTGFRLPLATTTFLTPQSNAMIGWKRTKPSYEEEYKLDKPMSEPSQYRHGYTFPCLFKVGGDGWVLISETGVDSRYCGSRLSELTDGNLYTIAFPMPEENNGNGTIEPAFSLPGNTAWRTITVGATLEPIVETTAPWDNVSPRYETQNNYKFGRGTWSWIVWQDNSINYNDQVEYIKLAKAMGYEYVLIDNWWDNNIGFERMAELVKYAQSQGVDVFLWWSSSGWWNDIEQGPVHYMSNSISRKQMMRWMHSLGVKGIKVDFFGGDKQETMRLYEDILSDADDNGLMCIFHGCTLPRGWERMYPNYVGSEAVLASENIYFNQHFCDVEAINTATHPFIRNTVGCMEFGGTFLNRHLRKGNQGGNTRRTTDCHELAQAILFQNPIQNFALTPENLRPFAEGGAPEVSLDFMRTVPTTWDETQFIDGYPGKFCILARRHADTWYIAGNNAEDDCDKVLDLSAFVNKGDVVTLFSDDATREPQKTQLKIKDPKKVKLHILHDGGFVIVK